MHIFFLKVPKPSLLGWCPVCFPFFHLHPYGALHLGVHESRGHPTALPKYAFHFAVGWVSQAILSTVAKEYTYFWGSRLTTYRKATFDDVKPILIALYFLPYTFDEEYRPKVDPTFTHVLSSNVPDPPYHSGPY